MKKEILKLGIDIGSSTTKIIEYENEKIQNKLILRETFSKEKLEEFINERNIKRLVNAVKVVKEDTNALKLLNEYYEKHLKPEI